MIVKINIGDDAIDHAAVDSIYCGGCPISYEASKLLKDGCYAAMYGTDMLQIGYSKDTRFFYDARTGSEKLGMDYTPHHNTCKTKNILVPFNAVNWQKLNMAWRPGSDEDRPGHISFKIDIPTEFLNEQALTSAISEC